MTTLKLSKPWAGHKPGATLEVLAPGENPRPGAIDPARAAALVAQQLAAPAAPAAAPVAKSTPKPSSKEA